MFLFVNDRSKPLACHVLTEFVDFLTSKISWFNPFTARVFDRVL